MKLGFVIPMVGPAVSGTPGLSLRRGIEDLGHATLWVGEPSLQMTRAPGAHRRVHASVASTSTPGRATAAAASVTAVTFAGSGSTTTRSHEGPRCHPGPLVVVRDPAVPDSAALARIARLAPAPAARAAAARADDRQGPDRGGLLGRTFLCGVGLGSAGGFGHGSLLEARARTSRLSDQALYPLHARSTGRINGAQRLAHGQNGTRHTPGTLRGGQAPSTPVTGWMSCWRSSACSPVTRYTTRLATDTAWSANRS